MKRRLPAYLSADGQFCYYFKMGTVPNDTVSFVGANGKKGYRGVVGYKTMLGGRLRYWHYAFSGKPIIRPETLFLIKGHVLFSDDGMNIWMNKDQMAKARRNQCRNWWNDEWRDRMYAAMAHIAGPGEAAIVIPLGATARFLISTQPIPFESPVSYTEPGEVIKEDDLRDYDFEDDDGDIEEISGRTEPGVEEPIQK
jgi:hypothetical protein